MCETSHSMENAVVYDMKFNGDQHPECMIARWVRLRGVAGVATIQECLLLDSISETINHRR